MPDNISREDRRRNMPPVPDNFMALLNTLQQSALVKLKQLGWEIWFIRRPELAPALPVMTSRLHPMSLMIDQFGHVTTTESLAIRP